MYHRYDIKVFQKGSESVSFIGNVSSALCFVLVISQIYLNFRHSSGQIKSLNVLFSFGHLKQILKVFRHVKGVGIDLNLWHCLAFFCINHLLNTFLTVIWHLCRLVFVYVFIGVLLLLFLVRNLTWS